MIYIYIYSTVDGLGLIPILKQTNIGLHTRHNESNGGF